MLKLGHDEAIPALRSGELLIRKVLRYCFGGPMTCHDFSGHSNAYKLEWADDTRPLVGTRTYSPAHQAGART